MYGVQLGIGCDSMVTNLRFADDILLVGRSLPQLKQMVADVAAEVLRLAVVWLLLAMPCSTWPHRLAPRPE